MRVEIVNESGLDAEFLKKALKTSRRSAEDRDLAMIQVG